MDFVIKCTHSDYFSADGIICTLSVFKMDYFLAKGRDKRIKVKKRIPGSMEKVL